MISDEEIALLRAHLDGDETVARLAAREGGTWKQDDPVRFPGAISSLGGTVVYDEGAPDENQAPHIARHDPARVLREVEVWRKILLEFAVPPGTDAVYGGTERETGFRLALSFALKAKIAAYGDAPTV